MKKTAARPAVQTSGAFRETFLFLFDPEDVKVLQRFVDVVEAGWIGQSAGSENPKEVSYTVAEMVAVAADLAFLATFLGQVAAERSSSGLDATERSLADFASRLAPQVKNLAEALEGELAGLLGDGENGFPAGDSKLSH